MNVVMLNFVSIIAIIVAAILIGSEFGIKIGISIALIGWALIKLIKI